jgi:hypothetical protein
MLFRAVIYGIDHRINILWINPNSNWFTCNNRSYRIDRKAVCQVVEKGGSLKGIVELLYVEGDPVPIGSDLDVKKITIEHLKERISESTNQPEKGNFLSNLFGK